MWGPPTPEVEGGGGRSSGWHSSTPLGLGGSREVPQKPALALSLADRDADGWLWPSRADGAPAGLGLAWLGRAGLKEGTFPVSCLAYK